MTETFPPRMAPSRCTRPGGCRRIPPHISIAAPSAVDLKAVLDKAVKFFSPRGKRTNGDLSPTPAGRTRRHKPSRSRHWFRDGYGDFPRRGQGARFPREGA